MKILVDAALSHVISKGLRAAGFDAVHVKDYQMGGASDEEIFARAAAEARTIISADTDFGTLLALREQDRPSVVLLRRGPKSPAKQLALLLANLPALEADAEAGSVMVVEESRIRVRKLPIGGKY